MSTQRASCATCRHWTERASKWSRLGHWGDCRIGPPASCRVDGNGAALTPGEPHWGVWPATGAADGCSKHEPADVAAAPVVVVAAAGVPFGPWSAERPSYGTHNPPPFWIVDEHGRVVADVQDLGRVTDRNATTLAAAPAMEWALRQIAAGRHDAVEVAVATLTRAGLMGGEAV